MNGEPVEGRNPEPSRAPLPPVTTRWAKPPIEDPGTAGSILPPFRHAFMSPAPPAVPVSPVTPPVEAVAADLGEATPVELEVTHLEIGGEAAVEQPSVLEEIIEATAPADAPFELMETDLTPASDAAEAWTLPPDESPIASHAAWDGLPESVYVPTPSPEWADGARHDDTPEMSLESSGAELETEIFSEPTAFSEPDAFQADVGLEPDASDLTMAAADLELNETQEPLLEEPSALTDDGLQLTQLSESVIEPYASADESIELIEVLEQVGEPPAPSDEEETWLLSADAVIEDEPWSEPAGEAIDEFATARAGFEGDEIVSADSIAGEEPWDAFGRALKESISWADLQPPETSELELTQELQTQQPLDTGDQEWAAVEPVKTGFPAQLQPSLPAVATPTMPQPLGHDPFADQLADRLQTLAIRLRHEGLRAISDAIAQGDRLEASLALFLAGYRAGRGE
ncbi:MAG: hypothetical protein ACREMQ_20730 [Longimicrobiales bacterium]